jgi:dipeptidyl aminopeptidase/acylaminoacyl peptidase
MKDTHPYGFWPSTISPEMLTQQSLRLSEPQILGEDIFWLETRPHEQGRNALVRMTALGMHHDVLPMPHSVRTRANEYGGGSYLVTEKYIFCVLDADQRVYAFNRDSEKLIPISPENSEAKTSWRYADFCWDALRQRLICVREDHTLSEQFERTEIVAITPESASVQVLVTGADFYCNPRLSPDASKLSYICWNHPLMPWDGTELYVASFNEDGSIASSEHIAGCESESVLQPLWSPSGELFFVSDRNNWWNIYRHTPTGAELMCDLPAEFATPQWTFGMRSYGFLNEYSILCGYSQDGKWSLGTIDLTTKTLSTIGIDLRDISGIFCGDNFNSDGRAVFLAGNSHQNTRLLYFKNDQLSVIAQTSSASLMKEDISVAQPVSFATSDGETANGFYYPPTNSKICGPDFTKPPLIVMCHGGPTGATESSLNMKIQFWTHRGFAVLDVNYRGSTGYGREYRDRLKNKWGVTDVIDVCSGADYLVSRGLVDKDKLAIRGSSAGGYTVLAALTFQNTFKAGASLYGIGDLEALARDTHKFEAHYLDGLIGQYPDDIATYRARSPIYHVDKLNCPVIFLQGLKDKVVPPNQAEAMVTALKQKGIKTVYVTFEDEGHGFRQAASIAKAITAELDFYQSIFAEVPEAIAS